MVTGTKHDRPGLSSTDLPSPLEARSIEIPDGARSLRSDALLLVVTDDGASTWAERTRRAAIELAASIGARILFYDRSAESRLVDAYASGPLTADTDLAHGEWMLGPKELRYLGRDYLARFVEAAEHAGVAAWAWLPRSVGQRAIAEAVTRFGCDLIVMPAELRGALDRRQLAPWRRSAAALGVPILLSGPDGSLQDWQLAGELSRVEFAVRQFGLLVVRGRFSDFDVRLEFDEAKRWRPRCRGTARSAPAATRIEARIAAASLETGIGVRDRDLRSARFFDVARHPYLTFASTRVTAAGGGYSIVGDLEIKGRRREVELAGEFHGVGAARGYRRATMSAGATVDRRDWGLTGGLAIGNRVSLRIDAVAVRASRDAP